MRRLILGIGAQKAATSWLYIQFFRQKHFKRPALKEMHVLDAIYLADQLPFRKEIEADFAKSLKAPPETYLDVFSTRRFHMLLDKDEYLRYYDELLDEEDCFSSDVTPSYSGLPEAAFEYINAGCKNLGISPRPVFILREPFSRVESAIRMRVRLAGKLETISQSELMSLIRHEAGSPGDRIRSSYRATVTRLLSVCEEKDVFIGFYETLFTPDEMRRLAHTTGLEVSRFDITDKVNQTDRRFRYPREFIEEIRARYQDEYDFVTVKLGLDRELWDTQVDWLVEK